MRSAALLCLLAAASCGAPSTRARRPTLQVEGRVMGGEAVDIWQVPWQVSVEYVKAHRCGASIVSPNWVMTCAWCVVGGEPYYYALRVGTSTRESGGIMYNVTSLIWHEEFDYVRDKDIGFIEVSDSFSFDDNVQAVSLATSELDAGTLVTLSGWGSLNPGEGYPEQLHAVNTTIVDRSSCNDTYDGYISEYMICAGEPEGGKDFCFGDFGGPLFANATQYGIISWGYGCYYGPYPGVYTDIVALRSWINETIGV